MSEKASLFIKSVFWSFLAIVFWDVTLTYFFDLHRTKQIILEIFLTILTIQIAEELIRRFRKK